MRNKPCCVPGCYGIVRDGECSVCKAQAERLPARQRGYDAAWQRTRAAVIEEATYDAVVAGIAPYPVCELCARPVQDTSEVQVDHVLPFSGLLDPLRLARGNLRVVHRACHMRYHGDSRRT